MQPWHAAPTQVLSPEAGWRLYKPQCLLAVDSLPLLIGIPPRGLLCGTASDLWGSLRSCRGRSFVPMQTGDFPETNQGPVWAPGASTLLEPPADSVADFAGLFQGCKLQSCLQNQFGLPPELEVPCYNKPPQNAARVPSWLHPDACHSCRY